MSDSQNWSSFEDPITPKRPTEAIESTENPKACSDEYNKGLSALVEPVALQNLRNRLIFGSLVGFVTGATFGGIDGARIYMKKQGRLSSDALSSVARGAATTGGAFSGFFFLYCGIKTAVATQRKDNLTSAGFSMVAAGIPFIRSAVFKRNIPYALMLVALDHFHEEISEFRK
ncbi:uncharacterized protein PHALS_08848 [Plasmopara halstedii]|uniref:Uncharacterized protein n=1 Tax=Plasmopara halstedii TaxID=4781 RepID=A0A0N7L4I8_PLAHL|nr:uncharacterized protein PHALS_08848 [Plasmopara halstedii]CEG38795.1 hypothetical protein PHALS_08848 [Plasmopara halstedii]|eukprot:XP_024575164.1 hypothetical protein PHALS_08848 [Plasmopara halstedii]